VRRSLSLYARRKIRHGNSKDEGKTKLNVHRESRATEC
jgi:hypothetical protein